MWTRTRPTARHEAITDLLRKWEGGATGPKQTAYLLTGDVDASGHGLLPTLNHIRENYRIMTGGQELTAADVTNYDGSGQPLLIDFIPKFVAGTNPPQLDLDAIGHYFVAGDGRANENVMLTSIHTIWARNHNFWVDKLKAETGGTWTEEEYFEGARTMNIAEYQRVVFTEFATAMAGGLDDDNEHGFEGYDPTVDASISVEFAQAAYRFGHSMLNETVSYQDENGQLQRNVAGAGLPEAGHRDVDRRRRAAGGLRGRAASGNRCRHGQRAAQPARRPAARPRRAQHLPRPGHGRRAVQRGARAALTRRQASPACVPIRVGTISRTATTSPMR